MRHSFVSFIDSWVFLGFANGQKPTANHYFRRHAMRNSKILSRLRAGQPARLAMMGYYLPPFVAYAADAGFDGIWLDLEHHNFDRREVQAMLAFFHLYDIDCLVRTPTREKAELYRFLEDGATGLIVPHVNDVASAVDLVQKVKFPPLGDRGIHGRGLETNYGLDSVPKQPSLPEHALRETLLILQIETPQALAVTEEIAAIPGVDGLYVGPADLSLRLAQQPPEQRITLDDALRQVAEICKRQAKPWGWLSRTTDELRQHMALGANILVWGVDARILGDGLKTSMRELAEVSR
jgi:2-keto-3-deoxy-L-rhamnonate aldolase RhmA